MIRTLVMDAAVFGNATLDIICWPVNDVPRYESMSFKEAAVAPGGCASNVAIWLGSLGVPTTLIARIGRDTAAYLAERYWNSVGLDLSQVVRMDTLQTGTSVGLVDSDAQPRFVHTSGANAELTVDDLDIRYLVQKGVKLLHVAGLFVLPGLMDGRLPGALEALQSEGIYTTLDVVRSSRMDNPQPLWSCLPHLDIFMCNVIEGQRITGVKGPSQIAEALRKEGLRIAIIKLGDQGCWLESDNVSTQIPTPEMDALDTTGAGDAFAAGLIAGILDGEELTQACERGNETGAKVVKHLGAVGPWMDPRLNR